MCHQWARHFWYFSAGTGLMEKSEQRKLQSNTPEVLWPEEKKHSRAWVSSKLQKDRERERKEGKEGKKEGRKVGRKEGRGKKEEGKERTKQFHPRLKY